MVQSTCFSAVNTHKVRHQLKPYLTRDALHIPQNNNNNIKLILSFSLPPVFMFSFSFALSLSLSLSRSLSACPGPVPPRLPGGHGQQDQARGQCAWRGLRSGEASPRAGPAPDTPQGGGGEGGARGAEASDHGDAAGASEERRGAEDPQSEWWGAFVHSYIQSFIYVVMYLLT